MNSFLQRYIIDICYPRRCLGCHEVVAYGEVGICQVCKEKLEYVSEPVCLRCGQPIMSAEEEYCLDCSRRKTHYERGYAVFVYNDIIKQSLSAFKYKNKREYADF